MLALAAPFAAIAQESVAVSYDGYVGIQRPLRAAKDLELFGGSGARIELRRLFHRAAFGVAQPSKYSAT
jgi:hypothetical protein